MKDFRKLMVWQKSHNIALMTYRVTGSYPKSELYGLTSQMRRASASIPTNIAEGCGRHSDAELARFCSIAAGSASELEYQIILSHDLGYITPDIYQEMTMKINEIKRMLNVFIRKLKANS